MMALAFASRQTDELVLKCSRSGHRESTKEDRFERKGRPSKRFGH